MPAPHFIVDLDEGAEFDPEDLGGDPQHPISPKGVLA
jgi:hypothetical protein